MIQNLIGAGGGGKIDTGSIVCDDQQNLVIDTNLTSLSGFVISRVDNKSRTGIIDVMSPCAVESEYCTMDKTDSSRRAGQVYFVINSYQSVELPGSVNFVDGTLTIHQNNHYFLSGAEYKYTLFSE